MLVSASDRVNVPSLLSSESPDGRELLSLGRVTQMVDGLKGRLGITDPVELLEGSSLYTPLSSSSGRFSGDKRTITVNLNYLSSLSHGEREFCLLHELAHLKNRDSHTDFLVGLAIPPQFLAGVVLLVKIASSASIMVQLVGLGLNWLGTRVTRSVFHQLGELRADKEAFMACSIEGKKGAMTFFKKALEEDREWCFAVRAIVYSMMFLRSGLEHPPLPLRIRRLQGLAQDLENKALCKKVD